MTTKENPTQGPAGGARSVNPPAAVPSVFAGADTIGSLEYIVAGPEDGRPLILLNSLEYPGWPPPVFCRLAGEFGFRTIAVRRPGFGRNPPLPDPDRQADLIMEFVQCCGFGGAVMVCSGTANPIGFRLCRACPHISLSVFANCAFNHQIMSEFQPPWFASALEQALQSPAGARLSLMGLKSSWGIFGRRWVHESVLRKSPGDLAFLRDHPEQVDEAIDGLFSRVDAQTFAMEIGASLRHDPMLQDGYFEGVSAMTVSGMETSPTWKKGVEAEAERLGVPLSYLPRGDALVVYQSAPHLLGLVSEALH